MLAMVCAARGRKDRATREEQAAAAGVSLRHFRRLVQEWWYAWPSDVAERWCEFCGVDFWTLGSQNLSPAWLRRVDWDTKNPQVREALVLSCQSQGVDPTPERLRKVASVLASTTHVGAAS